MAENIEPNVEVEYGLRPKGMFSKLLNRYRNTKRAAISDAKSKLFARYEIDFNKESLYKIVEDCVVLPSGKEIIELRLYKLEDAAIVTINTDMTTELEGGINYLREFRK
jgi:hypothetical protein